LWRAFRDDRLVVIELSNVDRATSRLTIDLLHSSKSKLKNVRKIIDEVVAKNLMAQEAQISVCNLADEA
jgi:hypothetical protein